jgi:hypothetical protein
MRSCSESKRPRRSEQPVVNVLVVESHQHALEHIHSALRSNNKRLGSPWELIHFDAHPDLACGTFPAKACFFPRLDFSSTTGSSESPKNLYDLLDATSAGIAEWILPLVVAAELTTIRWIKPPCSNQLPRGQHHLKVGAWVDPADSHRANHLMENFAFIDLPDCAKLKVDWKTPYYYDDDSVRPTSELLFAKSLDLNVIEVSNESDDPSPPMSIPWMLDICLDYFACRNPFLDELNSIDVEYTVFLQDLVQIMTNVANQATDYVQKSREIQDSFCHLLSTIANGNAIGDVTRNMENSLNESVIAVVAIHKFVTHLANAKFKQLLIQKSMEAWGVLTIPHEVVTATLGDERLNLLDIYLRSITCMSVGNPPFLVTIARSANDGFTPMDHVEQLQVKILKKVHSLLCGCVTNMDWSDPQYFTGNESCRVNLIFDYGQWEGSTL